MGLNRVAIIMNKLCAGVGPEQAVSCCACKFPLPVFCEEHANKHRSAPANHFTLPLTACLKITSKQAFHQIQNRLSFLNNNFKALRERAEEFSQDEEKIDAVYQEVQSYASEVRAKLKKDFSVVKTEYQAAIEYAINETSANALEEFQPVNPFSYLLWYYDPGYIATCEMYSFQAKCVKEHLNAAFQVAAHFTVQGFEHLKFGAIVQSPREREEDFMKAAALKDEQHYFELECLRKELAGEQVKETENAQLNQQLKSAYQNLELHFQEAQAELTRLRSDAVANDQRCYALQNENSAFRQRNQTLEGQLKGAEKQLEELRGQCQQRDQEINALRKQLIDQPNSRDQSRDTQAELKPIQLQFRQIQVAPPWQPPREPVLDLPCVQRSGAKLAPRLKKCCLCCQDQPFFMDVFGKISCMPCLKTRYLSNKLSNGMWLHWTAKIVFEVHTNLWNCLPQDERNDLPSEIKLPLDSKLCIGRKQEVAPGYPSTGHIIGLNAICDDKEACANPDHVLCKGCALKLLYCPICNAKVIYEELPTSSPECRWDHVSSFYEPCPTCGQKAKRTKHE